ncbi:MAG TPA: right-handed parallel beta-helix repeat-containing protein [Candidatus Nanoarchaeia archaeon]|nr:right-handed parallel beta-helix repeat-containing protein [Candidatus Nanoarchaeia archaeon]
MWTLYANDTSDNTNITTIAFNSTTYSVCGVLNITHATYSITKDISTTTTCFTITAENITLNLKAYNISASGNNIGISIGAYNDTTIKNGVVHKFNQGITSTADRLRFINLTLSAHTLDGIVVTGSRNVTLENSTLLNNGRYGLFTITTNDSTIRKNRFINNSQTFSTLYSIGIWGVNNWVMNNTIRQSNSRGVKFTGNSNYLKSNNIVVSSYALYITQGNSTIVNNNLTSTNSFSIFDDSPSSSTQDLIYNNSLGEIQWINSSFLGNMDINGTFTFPGAIKIRNNSAYFNTSAFGSNMNSSANITLFGIGDRGIAKPFVLRNGGVCRDCHNFTSLEAATVKFNVTSWSNYSIGADTIAPAFNATPSNRTLEYGVDALNVRFNVSDDAAISTFFVNDTRFNITKGGHLRNRTKLAPAVYTLNISVNDTSGNLNMSYKKVTVQDTIKPAVHMVNVTPSYGAVGTQFNLSVNASDKNLSKVWAFLQKPDENNTARLNLSRFNNLYNTSWNSTGVSEGTYLIDIFVNDTSNNTRQIENGAAIALSTYARGAYYNFSINLTANVSRFVNATDQTNVSLNITSLRNRTASLAIASYTTNLKPVLPSGVAELRSYKDIILDNTTNNNLSSAIIQIYYSDAEVSAAGLIESTLRIHKFDTSSNSWFVLEPGGVDTESNRVWGNTTRFSHFGVFGAVPPVTASVQAVPSSGSLCIPKWNCTAWSDCSSEGTQERICTRVGTCNLNYNKPNETQSCTYIAPLQEAPAPPNATQIEKPSPVHIKQSPEWFRYGIILILAIIAIVILLCKPSNLMQLFAKMEKELKLNQADRAQATYVKLRRIFIQQAPRLPSQLRHEYHESAMELHRQLSEMLK